MVKFGTGGWRAVIGDEFTRENIQKLAKALAMKMQLTKGYVLVMTEDSFPRKLLCGVVRYLLMRE